MKCKIRKTFDCILKQVRKFQTLLMYDSLTKQKKLYFLKII